MDDKKIAGKLVRIAEQLVEAELSLDDKIWSLIPLTRSVRDGQTPEDMAAKIVERWSKSWGPLSGEDKARILQLSKLDLGHKISANTAVAKQLIALAEKIAYPEYPFYVVFKGAIISGWDYREDANDALQEVKEGGFKGAKVFTAKYCKAKHITWSTMSMEELDAVRDHEGRPTT